MYVENFVYKKCTYYLKVRIDLQLQFLFKEGKIKC